MAPAAPTTLLPSPPPITDRIALGALTHTFPPELVDQVIQQTGRAEQRRRLLPARVVVDFVLALALYRHAAYEECCAGWWRAGLGGAGAPWPAQLALVAGAGRSALAEARTRLGPGAAGGVVRPGRPAVGDQGDPGAWDRHWRLLVVDGTCLDVPDTPANQQALGRRPAAGASSARRSRRSGWWGWWRPARTRSSTPPRGRMGPGSRRRHKGWPVRAGRLGRGCWWWPTGWVPAPSGGGSWPGPARSWCGGSGAPAGPPQAAG
jgi:Insertion element 4 transposase N-terminal